MAETWDAPGLGRLTFDTDAWTTTVDLPAFAAFTFGGGGRPAYELAFEVEDETDVPSADAVAVAGAVVANQARLATAVAAALWDDFNGRGPRSGMWWHGHLDDVPEGADDGDGLPPLTGPAALMAWMRLSRAIVRPVRRHEPDGGRVVELRFNAAFEVEHDVGVLTDGTSILGTGYAYDVRLF